MIKRGFALLLVLLLFAAPLTGCAPRQSNLFDVAAVQKEIAPSTKGIYIVESQTGHVVFERDAQKLMRQGALNHLMVALLVLEVCPDPTIVEAKSNPATFADIAGKNLPNIDMWEEETYLVEDLLHAMLLGNAYDATNLLAQHFGGGDIAQFVNMMNEKATEIGMNPDMTRFRDPNGLVTENQFTNVAEYYKLVQYLLTNKPQIMTYLTKESHTIAARPGQRAFEVKNINSLTNTEIGQRFPGAVGLGYSSSTDGKGSLAAVVTIAQIPYVAVFIDAEGQNADTADSAIRNPGATESSATSSAAAQSSSAPVSSEEAVSSSSATTASAPASSGAGETPPAKDDKTLFQDATSVLDWVESYVRLLQLAPESNVLFSVNMLGEEFVKSEIPVGIETSQSGIITKAEDRSKIWVLCVGETRFSEPLKKGQVVGLATVIDREKGTEEMVNLVALDSSNASPFTGIMIGVLRLILILACIALLLLVLIRLRNVRAKKRAHEAKMKAARQAAMEGSSVGLPPGVTPKPKPKTQPPVFPNKYGKPRSKNPTTSFATKPGAASSRGRQVKRRPPGKTPNPSKGQERVQGSEQPDLGKTPPPLKRVPPVDPK